MPDTPQGQDERLVKSLERARQLKEAGQTHDTIEWCKKILGVYPGNEEASRILAEAQASLGSQLIEDLISMGQKHFDIGDYDAAIIEWTKVKSMAPDDPRAAQLLAEAEAQKSGGASPVTPDALDLPDPADTLDLPEPSESDVPELPDLPSPEEEGESFHLPDPDDLLSSAEAETSAPSDFDSIPDAGEAPAAPEAPRGTFGIDESDPFALGEDIPAAPIPPEDSPAPPPAEDMDTQPAPPDKPEPSMSDMLVTSEKMHEAVDDFSAKVDTGPAPPTDLEAAAQEMGLNDLPEPDAEVPSAESIDLPSPDVPEIPAGDASLDLPEPAAPEIPAGGPDPDLPESEAPSLESDALKQLAPETPVGEGGQDLPEPEAPGKDVSRDLPDPEAPGAEENLLEISGTGATHAPEELARIKELFQKGQSYYERGQCQQAVDTWYQILLIDEHHPEAVAAIEKAQGELELQGKKLSVDLPESVLEDGDGMPSAEGARDAMNALLQSAQKQFDEGNYPEAVAQCEKVVEIDPINREANRIMHEANLKIQAQEAKAPAQEAPAPDPSAPAPAAPGDSAAMPSIAAPPKPGIPLAVLLGGIGLVIFLGVLGAVLFIKFGKPEVTPPPPPAPIVKEAPVEVAPEPEPVDTGPSDEEVLKFARNKALDRFEQARLAYADKKYFEAVQFIIESVDLNPSDIAAIDYREQLQMAHQAYQEEAGRYASASSSFKEGNYDDALRFFYRMTKGQYYSFETQMAISKGYYSLQHSKGDIEAYIRKCWYNRGIQNLADQDCEKAIDAFRELLILDPNDVEAKRNKTMAERYKTKAKDESYFQYVEFLRARE